MQSRYQAMPASARVKFSGEAGYAALANGSTSQRQWTEGALTSSKPSEGAATPSNTDSGISRGSQLRASSVSSSRRH